MIGHRGNLVAIRWGCGRGFGLPKVEGGTVRGEAVLFVVAYYVGIKADDAGAGGRYVVPVLEQGYDGNLLLVQRHVELVIHATLHLAAAQLLAPALVAVCCGGGGQHGIGDIDGVGIAVGIGNGGKDRIFGKLGRDDDGGIGGLFGDIRLVGQHLNVLGGPLIVHTHRGSCQRASGVLGLERDAGAGELEVICKTLACREVNGHLAHGMSVGQDEARS